MVNMNKSNQVQVTGRRIGKKYHSMKQSKGDIVFDIFNMVFLLILGLTMIYPMYYIIVYSLNEGLDAMKGGLYLWPRVFTTFNYEYVFSNGVIQHAYIITILRTIIGTFTGLLVTGMTAYGMSLKNLPYRKGLLILCLIPMLFNGGLIPYYIQLSKLKLLDSFWVYIIPAMFNVWNMFVMMKFFMGIPESLRESALIDGAGEFTIFFKIIIPLAKPVIAAIGLFIAVTQWNDWYSGAFYISSAKLLPVQTYLQRLFEADNLNMLSSNSRIVAEASIRQAQTNTMTVMSVKMAAVVVGTVPILCVYPFVQKYFVKGMLIGSVKG